MMQTLNAKRKNYKSRRWRRIFGLTSVTADQIERSRTHGAALRGAFHRRSDAIAKITPEVSCQPFFDMEIPPKWSRSAAGGVTLGAR